MLFDNLFFFIKNWTSFQDSIDASVVQINEKNDFRVTSNVSSTTFGVHDLDERIVQYIIEQRTQRMKRIFRREERERLVEDSIEITNAYKELMGNIKEDIACKNAVSLFNNFQVEFYLTLENPRSRIWEKILIFFIFIF